MENSVIGKLQKLLETSEKWVIVDAQGTEHELSEGIQGTPRKVDPTEEILTLLGINPKYITYENLKTLDTLFEDILELVYQNASYSVKKKYDKYLDSIDMEE